MRGKRQRGRGVAGVGFIVPDGDATELLDPVEEVLNRVTHLDISVMRDRRFAVAFAGMTAAARRSFRVARKGAISVLNRARWGAHKMEPLGRTSPAVALLSASYRQPPHSHRAFRASSARLRADRREHFVLRFHQPGEGGMSETRKFAAILVADVVGCCRRSGADEERTLALLRGLRSADEYYCWSTGLAKRLYRPDRTALATLPRQVTGSGSIDRAVTPIRRAHYHASADEARAMRWDSTRAGEPVSPRNVRSLRRSWVLLAITLVFLSWSFLNVGRRLVAQRCGGRRCSRLPMACRAIAAGVALTVAQMAEMTSTPAVSATAGTPGSNRLLIVNRGKTDATIVLSPEAGRFERHAAEDLAKYIEAMTGVSLPIYSTDDISAALTSKRQLLIIGQNVFAAKPELKNRLAAVLKQKPLLRADGIVLLREGNRVYLAGSNDESHYFAVAELLRAWGVRWFMPGPFGECVPEESELSVGDLDIVSSPAFEVRSFWVSWLGDTTGVGDFKLRNMMTSGTEVPAAGHALARYTKGLGEIPFEIPLTDPSTAEQVARETDQLYAAGKNFSLAMEDTLYTSTYPRDAELMALQWDKYMLRPSVTDPMLELLNNVARRLRERHPTSQSKIGFLAYSNMFLPPVRETTLEPSLYGMLAPIDIDPIHSMDDPQSPSRQEYRTILDKWAKLAGGRLTIYDYDQSMLVWRDLPDPSQHAFQQDVKRYRDAGVLGIFTESRMALATTQINLYVRGRLMWNPDEDIDGLLDDFYAKFFGPAQPAMRDYWSTILDAWRKTIVTEHEFFVAPAIYTPEIIERLGVSLQQAEKATEFLRSASRRLSRNEQLYLERLRFVQLGFETLKSYIAMVSAAGTNVDFKDAVSAGERGLRAREALTEMNPAFTTTKLEKGYAFWPGELEQYRELLKLVNGEKGRLLVALPLEWNFHRDPGGTGTTENLLDGSIDLSFWRMHGSEYNLEARKDYPSDQWEVVRTDLYVQAQGIRAPDRASYTGDLWYRSDVHLRLDQATAGAHIMFPGLFNDCALYVDGIQVAQRPFKEPWWLNDYRFEWDVALNNRLHQGANAITLRCHNPDHMGGMFRRPFLYVPIQATED